MWYVILYIVVGLFLIGMILWPLLHEPELDLFHRGAERRQALRAARKRVYNFKRRFVKILPAMLLALVNPVLDMLDVSPGKALEGVFAISPVVLVMWFATGEKKLMRLELRKQLANLNRCVHCGYDLQGNESGICPECGTSVQIDEPS